MIKSILQVVCILSRNEQHNIRNDTLINLCLAALQVHALPLLSSQNYFHLSTWKWVVSPNVWIQQRMQQVMGSEGLFIALDNHELFFRSGGCKTDLEASISVWYRLNWRL